MRRAAAVAPAPVTLCTLCASCALCAATLRAAPARAAEPARPPVRLAWSVAPAPGQACLDAAGAEAALRDLVGAAAPNGGSPDAVTVDIAPQADGLWRARIATEGASGSGERQFTGATCERVARAAVLVVALALEPVRVAEHLAALRPKATPAEEAAAPEHARAAAGLLVTGDIGSLPEVTAGAGLALGLELPAARLELSAAAWIPRTAHASATPAIGGEIGLYTTALRGCVEPLRVAGGEVRFGPCVAGEVGVTTGRGAEGVVHPAESSGFWLAAFGGAAIRDVRPSGWTSSLAIDVGVPIRRPVYELQQPEVSIFQASPVVGRVTYTMAWIFP